ncbi:uncharacterized protein TrAtP1_009793 [Trichoderma atroviride]|uniref:uncharacterized protein n=1 Tax=Hypocrea atroviridis TaxID=63577 RepID=UPI003320590B|nr:hypothetical protein TrAtP1_009793 [Trichoderma atroviride]
MAKKRRRGARHATCSGYHDDNRWGEASRVPIDGPPIEHHSKAGSVAPPRESNLSSSSVYLFALEAYSSPIPTASALGLIERETRPAVGGCRLQVGAWWRKAGGGGELGRRIAKLEECRCR